MHTLQTLDSSEAAKLAMGQPPAKGSDAAAEADVSDKKQAGSSAGDSKSSSRLGSLLQSLSSSNITRIGGGTTSLLGSFRGTTANTPVTGPMTAHMRALAAAAKVEDLPPLPKRHEQPKKLVWAEDEALVATRLFFKNDVIINVRQDPPELAEPPEEEQQEQEQQQQEEEQVEGFEQLARREHAVEAALLKGMHLAEDEDEEQQGGAGGAGGAQQPVLPHPLAGHLLPWARPPEFKVDAGWAAAFGEESTEAAVLQAAAALHPAVQYTPGGPALVPEEAPFEVPVDNSSTASFPIYTPAELEQQKAAAAAAAAAAPPMQAQGMYQQQVPMQHMAGGAAGPLHAAPQHGAPGGMGYGGASYHVPGAELAGPGPGSQGMYGRRTVDEFGPGGLRKAGVRKCAFFNTPGGCKKGDNCEFQHVREGNFDVGPPMPFMGGRGGARGPYGGPSRGRGFDHGGHGYAPRGRRGGW